MRDSALSSAGLKLVNISQGDLHGIIAEQESFLGANLADTNMTRDGLSYANLTGANLRRCYLPKANLRNAQGREYQRYVARRVTLACLTWAVIQRVVASLVSNRDQADDFRPTIP